MDGRDFEVEVISSLTDYVDLMKEIFDFPQLKEFLKDFKLVVNGMHAGVLLCVKCFYCSFHTS